MKVWSEEASERLRDWFDTTDWKALCSLPGGDIKSLTNCITDYIHFCVENTVPHKEGTVFYQEQTLGEL